MTDMEPRYEPSSVEGRIYAFWRERDAFRAVVDGAREPYTIVIPPPNVTGALHMGHALNNTIQDVLIRFERKRGKVALWLPGTDHAGIATQNVVEKQLKKEGTSRQKLGREAFLARVWAWKDEYGNRILSQLERMGSSCDWSRTRFTLDEGLARAVRVNFKRLYDEKLIYRGKRIINWCPRCETALADDEVEKPERDSHIWHLKYPVKGEPGRYVIVATTRPETMLGDLGVAVHPNDPRYADLKGRMLVLPLLEREIPVVFDAAVDREFGTGAVKVTPSHDPNDFEIGARHQLGLLRVMDDRAVMNEHAGAYQGLKREEARKRVVADLEAKGLLDQVVPHRHAVGQCYRCDTIVEPIESLQWFVSMRPLADAALAALERGEPRFHPDRWARFYESWLKDVRDWCISRQLWWGHRIPVFTCDGCSHEFATEDEAPQSCPACGGTSLRQDEDVLDTWFSSALWPFSTLGWPDDTEDLRFFYPTSTLSTDRGIIFFWVARMVMMGLHNLGKVPFTDVNIHSTVLDEKGRKMSKSLGNGIDPLDVIEKYGADAMRYSLIDLTVEGQDTKLSVTKFEKGRNFANKLWNAARFAMLKLGAGRVRRPPQLDDLADRWILSRLAATLDAVTHALSNFRLNEAARDLYAFAWNDFCDWYLEIAKPRLEEGADEASREACRYVVATVLRDLMHLIHPLMPFLSEEIWRHLRAQGFFDALDEALITAPWPSQAGHALDPQADGRVGWLQELVRGIRNARARNEVEPARTIDVVASLGNADEAAILEQGASWIEKLAKVNLRSGVRIERPADSDVEVVGATELFFPLRGMIDLGKARGNLERSIAKVDGARASLVAKLGNDAFRSRAPAEVVVAEEKRLAELEAELAALRRNLEALPAS
jgi:valyl-tRNA synthetase